MSLLIRAALLGGLPTPSRARFATAGNLWSLPARNPTACAPLRTMKSRNVQLGAEQPSTSMRLANKMGTRKSPFSFQAVKGLCFVSHPSVAIGTGRRLRTLWPDLFADSPSTNCQYRIERPVRLAAVSRRTVLVCSSASFISGESSSLSSSASLVIGRLAALRTFRLIARTEERAPPWSD
jgi:hypothetical protein